ncbi:unnamed protein product [Prunus brigantina]
MYSRLYRVLTNPFGHIFQFLIWFCSSCGLIHLLFVLCQAICELDGILLKYFVVFLHLLF